MSINMSHCRFENTSKGLDQILDDRTPFEDLSDDEKAFCYDMVRQCYQFLKLYEINGGLIDD